MEEYWQKNVRGLSPEEKWKKLLDIQRCVCVCVCVCINIQGFKSGGY